MGDVAGEVTKKLTAVAANTIGCPVEAPLGKKDKDKGKNKASKSADSLFRVIIGNHYHLSQMADNKAHIMITICAAMLGFGVTGLFDPQLRYATAVLLLGCLSALSFAVYATMPSGVAQQKLDPKDPKFNIIFFSFFIHLPPDEFDREMEALICDKKKIHQSLVKDLYGHGQALGHKYRFLRYCYLAFLAGVVLSALVFGVTSVVLPLREGDAMAQITPADQKHPARVLIIRHAEDPPDADMSVDLSARGKERAKALHLLFEKSEKRPDPFPKPDFIFAAKDSKRSHRARMTVVPLAANLGLTINSDFANEKESKLAEELFKPKYAGQTILISWHHGTAQSLAHELKVAHAPKWKEEYDRVWEITYDEDRKATFRIHPQQLLPQDSQK